MEISSQWVVSEVRLRQEAWIGVLPSRGKDRKSGLQCDREGWLGRHILQQLREIAYFDQLPPQTRKQHPSLWYITVTTWKVSRETKPHW